MALGIDLWLWHNQETMVFSGIAADNGGAGVSA
jgi:hypothetical protein